MEELQHFTHEHVLSLVYFPKHNNEDFDKEEETEEEEEEEEEEKGKDDDKKDNDDFVVDVGKCNMCKEDIYSFHLCYYSCKECDYSLHKFCAKLPITQETHPLHPGHNLTMSHKIQLCHNLYDVSYITDRLWECDICKIVRENFYNYYCSMCKFTMDIICATTTEQKMDHPSHPHQLQRYFSRMISPCNACGDEHSGTFYHCTTCSWFRIHLDCVLLPTKLLIQQSTNESFTHPHLLTLAYSFPQIEKEEKFYPQCRVCDGSFSSYKWHYRCNKCQYYVHVRCATSMNEAFMSIRMRPGLGKTFKNFEDDDHPNLITCPFPDESFNLLKNLFINRGEFIFKRKIDGEMLNHQHPLILFDTEASLLDKTVSLHDPMRKVELLCDGCVRPIMNFPFYKCFQRHCGFFLHEWCTRLPSEIQNYHDHQDHTLVLLPKVPNDSLGLFVCKICFLYSNGFAYGCIQCNYYVDINCAFIPDVITHDAHPNHILQRFKGSTDRYCNACDILIDNFGFHCLACDFYIHTTCALLLTKTIRHKYDKHPLILRYEPAENQSGEYFCEICEDKLIPTRWFYHCSICASSIHTGCAPLILQCEQSTQSQWGYLGYLLAKPIFKFINVKFGGTHYIRDHRHAVTFVQDIDTDGPCIICDGSLEYEVIFKCFECKFVCHVECATVLSSGLAICAD